MRILFNLKMLAAVALISIGAFGVGQAQEPPPVAADDSALPPNIAPGTPLAEAVKLIHAGMDTNTILSYIVNSSSAFDLDADKIIFLKDEGASSALINAMIERDKVLYANGAVPAATPPTTVDETASAPDTAPPATEITPTYFNDTLTPYGSWVDVEGYGRCWRPTVVIYDSAWRPYCDRGHWVNSDYGWYWDSDYSWGAAFHYGRWFRNSRYGWCWYPDTVWAPSWVTWRSDNDYCGWAPLPPRAVYRPGSGFFYRGVSVGINFDFGLAPDCFTFVSPNHFYERHPRYYSAPPQRVPEIFHQTRVINNFNVSDRRIVNRGIPVERIATATHRPLTPVHVGALPYARRQGWRGENFAPTHENNGRNLPNENGQLRHGPALPNNPNNENGDQRQHFQQSAPNQHPTGNPNVPPHSQTFQQPGLHNTLPPANNYHPPLQNQPANTFHQPQAQPSQRFVTPNAPIRTFPPNIQRDNRNSGAPALCAPPIRSAPPERFITPRQPPVIEHAPPPPPQVEQHQNVPAPHNNPPPPRAPAPPGNNGSNHGGDKQHN